jgi:hypothetical protein
MAQVSEERLDAARDYARRRLESEASFSANLYIFYEEAVRKIVEVVKKYLLTADDLMNGRIPEKAKAEINKIIDEMCEEIAESVYLLADDGRDDAWFLAFMKMEFETGGTFDDVLEKYGDRFGDQILMACAALMLMSVPFAQWVVSITSNIRDLFNSPFVKGASREKVSYFSPRGFGQGVPNNMSVAIENLGKHEIAQAWMLYDHETAVRDGAKGFYVYRGSSYDCPECDSHVGYHKVTDMSALPPIHHHCYCFVVYEY